MHGVPGTPRSEIKEEPKAGDIRGGEYPVPRASALNDFMTDHIREKRPKGFWPLATVFALFVLFLYGPMITIFVLSFQGPEGGLTFPLRGVSLHWFYKLAEGLGTVDIGAAFRRSLALGAVVMAAPSCSRCSPASRSARSSRAATPCSSSRSRA